MMFVASPYFESGDECCKALIASPVYYMKLSDKAISTARQSDQVAGYDLHSAQQVFIPAKGKYRYRPI